MCSPCSKLSVEYRFDSAVVLYGVLSRPSSRAWADRQRYCSERLLQLEKCSFMKTGAPVDKGKCQGF